MKKIIFFLIGLFGSFAMMGQECQIGAISYATLEDALAAIPDGQTQTITLLTDVTRYTPIDLGKRNITFVLNLCHLKINSGDVPGSTALTTGGDLTVNGGWLDAIGAVAGLHFNGTNYQNLSINNSITLQSTGTIAGAAGFVSDALNTTITGYGTLNTKSSGTNGDGIRLTASNAGFSATSYSYSNGILILAYGSGTGNGLNFTAEGDHTVTINIANPYISSIFYGGENGNALNYPGTTGTLTIYNSGQYSNVDFRGGSVSGNGIYTKANLAFQGYCNGNYYRLYPAGNGTGCGIKLDNTGKTLDFSGVNGGFRTSGIWVGSNTTINAGYSGVSSSSHGAGIYAAGALTLTKSGTAQSYVYAAGADGSEGIVIENGGDLTMSGNLKVTATGDAGAQGLVLSGAGKVNFTDARQTLTVNNNSANAEAVPCHQIAALVWTVTDDGYIPPDNDMDNDITCTIQEASSGTRTTTISLTNGIPAITTIPGDLSNGMVNIPYNQTLTATNRPTSWAVASGSLPPGLVLSNDGRITGVPVSAGVFSFTATASTRHGVSTPVSFNITIENYVEIVPVTNITGVPAKVGMGKSVALTGTVYPTDATYQNITWNILSDGGTGAYIYNGYPDFYLGAQNEGEVIVTATVANGITYGVPFTQNFTITVTDGVVCEIVGGNRYNDLQNAIWDVPSNSSAVIRLLDNVDIINRINSTGQEITFDLNGYNLTVTSGEGGGINLYDSRFDYVGQGSFKGVTGPYGYSNVLSLMGNSSCTMTGIEISNPDNAGISCNYGSTGVYNGNVNVNSTYGIPIIDFTMNRSINATAVPPVDANGGIYGIRISGSDFTMNGNINATAGTAVYADGGATVIINGTITAPNYISIAGVIFSAGDKSSVSSKPGYDEYTDGASHVWVKIPITPEVIAWKGTAEPDNENWYNAANWDGGQVPPETAIVVIPGTAGHFPVLTGSAKVGEIHFEPGARIGNQHYLEGKAFVKYDLSETNRWHMLSIPLGQVYPGDFTFGGYPVTWIRTFSTSGNGSLTNGKWVTARGSGTSFSYGDGFVLWLNEDNSTVDKGLKLLGGIRELPFFRHQAQDSPDKELYDKVHQSHDYSLEKGESTFYNYLLNGTGEYVRDVNTHYSVPRGDDAYRLLAEDPYEKPLNFGTNNEANGDVALVGNPYMAALDFDALYAENGDAIKPCYQVWMGSGYGAYTSDGYAGNIVGEALNQCIAPLQAFLVEKPETPAATSLKFMEKMAKANGSAVLRSSESNKDKLNIIARNPAGGILTFIAKREGGRDSFGNLDVRKIINAITDLPEIYTLKPYKSSSIGTAVNIIDNDDILIPVGLATNFTGAITLSFSGMNAYNANLSLIDAVADEEFNLTGLTSYDYTFNYTPKTVNGTAATCEDRFFVRISKTLTGLEKSVAGKVNVYEKDGQIRITSNASNPVREVNIYNLQGVLIYKSTALHSVSHTIDLDRSAGIYIVKVITEKDIDNVKIIMK